MKLRYLGLFLIIIGFAAPFTLRVISAKVLYTSIVTAFCFWTGFLLILRPLKSEHRFNPYLTWASYAIWINIVLTILLTLCFYLIFYLDIRRGIAFHAMSVLAFINNPVGWFFDTIVPPSSVEQPDGSVHFTYSFIGGLLTAFFNLVVYSIVGVLAKVLRDEKITAQST